ncbi:MAG: SDR family NAD(P)-dependent oxidoreductase, partial [Ilumatobacteraceae bacterium]
ASTFYGHEALDWPTPPLFLVAVVLQIVAGQASGLYRGRFRPFSFDEMGGLAITVATVGVLLIGVEHVAWNEGRNGQILVLATSVAVCIMFGHRYVRRVRAQHVADRDNCASVPLIVFGAGEGGYQAITAMQSRDAPYRPAALVDDDPGKCRRRIGGVRVEGTSTDLRSVAARHGARVVLLAVPSATGRQLHRLHLRVKAAGLDTLVMPPVQPLVGGRNGEFKRYTDEDVLDRKIVEIEQTPVRQLVSDTCVLVTGAGGSIGSELVRQLLEFEPSKVIALDHDDSHLHSLIASLPTQRRDRCIPLIGDVRDPERLATLFAHHAPDLVFHAAALKHVPALEDAPSEGWKTNVIGTMNVVAAAEHAGVSRLVNISTDKAASPVNVLGFTKRIAERLTADAAHRTGRPYVSVRFGNVIGSRGSALETFEQQIRSGGPVTVTDPDVTRYFMAVREAVRLTMQAAAIGRAAEALVLDMGEPVKVIDIAEQLIEQSGHDVDIVITGLRPGEKMHEVLLGDGETPNRPCHSMIDHVSVPPLDLDLVARTCDAEGISPYDSEGLRRITEMISPCPHDALLISTGATHQNEGLSP